MTLGISYSLSGQPFVIADLLLSGDEKEHDVSIPSVGNIEEVFPKGSAFSIIGLCQKVIVISRRLVVAWAGSPLAAAFTIRELRQMERAGLNFESLLDFLQVLPQELQALELSLTGWFIDPEGNDSYSINFDAQDMTYAPFESLTLIGSGSSMFEEMLRNREFVAGASKGLPPEQSLFLTHTFSLTGLLLELELKQKTDSLHLYFGGGYEVVICDQSGFKKFDEITYVFWNIDVSAEGVGITLPYHAQKQYYVDDDLIIVPLRFHKATDSRVLVESDEPYRVLEPGKRLSIGSDLSLGNVSLNSTNACHYFIERSSGHVFVRYQYRENPEDIGVFFSGMGEGVQLRINKTFLDSISHSLMSNPRWRRRNSDD